MTSATDKHRVLAIDGGGLKGMVPTALLAEIEQYIDRPAGEYFDLIVGTSTGGIIAAALACGWKASDIVQLYRESGPKIFPTLLWPKRLWLSIAGTVRSKYPTAALRRELERHFGDMTIGAARKRLVIPSWDPARQTVYVWKTRHCGRFRTDHRKKLVDALVSTASAPTYFACSRKSGGSGLIDGGVWANNPMLVAAVEAVGVLGWDPESVYMLSLGCIREDYIAPESGGLLKWLGHAAPLFLQAQSAGAAGGSYLLLCDRPNAPQRVLRLEASAPRGRLKLDSASDLTMLEQMGRHLARERLEQLAQMFFDDPAAAFVPVPESGANTEVA